jgi:hypothetical protein
LDAQMIFLVDHQADLLAAINGHAAGPFAFGMLAADELALDQELPIQPFEFVDVEILEMISIRNLHDALAQRSLDLDPIGRRGLGNERMIGQIAGQTNPAADHNVRLRT